MINQQVKCQKCGNLNDEDAKICTFCGELLKIETETKKFDDTDYQDDKAKWGSARFTPHTHLVLGIEGEPRSLLFKAIEIEELVLGRSDPKTGDKPDIDLSDYGAIEKGVSRKHAVINRKDNALYIIDQNARNGTYLNGQKLIAYQERVLRDGDDVRLGHLAIKITFEQI